MIEVYQNEIHITKQETASISVAFYSDGTPVLLQAGDSIVFKLFSSPKPLKPIRSCYKKQLQHLSTV